MANSRPPVDLEPTRWTIHSERLADDTRRLRLSIAQVELPDGLHFEQYVLRMPKAAMTVLLDDARERVLTIWRHRFVLDQWTWKLPGGCVDSDEDPAVTAAREVVEETGWRPRSMTLLTRPVVVGDLMHDHPTQPRCRLRVGLAGIRWLPSSEAVAPSVRTGQ